MIAKSVVFTCKERELNKYSNATRFSILREVELGLIEALAPASKDAKSTTAETESKLFQLCL
jgi:hypothetical protein